MTAIARFAEPLALTSVFPYLPEMISSFGVEQNDVAKWAGYTSAVFSLSQSVTAVAWGRASDRIGRKPAIIIGLISTMVFFVVWGMSTSLPMAIVVRAILGSGNGNGACASRHYRCPKANSIMVQLASSGLWWRKWFPRRSCSLERSPSCP